MSDSEKIYLEILKYGFEHSEGVSYYALIKYLEERNLTFNNSKITESHTIILNIFQSSFQNLHGHRVDIEDAKRGNSYYLKPEAISYLMNYEMFQLAKKDSAEALKNSEEARKESLKAEQYTVKALRLTKWSLWISSACALISIVLSIIQLMISCK